MTIAPNTRKAGVSPVRMTAIAPKTGPKTMIRWWP